MARQQQVSYTLTCDICGVEISERDSEGASRKISWEGAEFHIDLCATHQGELDKCLHQLREFVDAASPTVARRGRGAARRSTRTPQGPRAAGPRSTPASGGRSDIPAIRVWARENGYQVGDRARIAAPIMAAYDEAQGTPQG